jgi:hypothetical protein
MTRASETGTIKRLRKASSVDAEAMLDRFLESAGESSLENPHSFVKTLVNRTLDAIGPAVFEMSKRVYPTVPPGLYDVSIQAVRTGENTSGIVVKYGNHPSYMFLVTVDDPSAQAPKITDVAVKAAFFDPAIGNVSYSASPASPGDDSPSAWTASNLSGSDPCGWVWAFRAFKAAANHTGYLPSVSQRALEIGSREYDEIVEDDADALLCEAGAAAALMDDGIPCVRAAEIVSKFQANLATRALRDEMPVILNLAKRLNDEGYTDAAHPFEHDDGDFQAFFGMEDNATVLHLHGDPDSFAVVIQPHAPNMTVVSIARCERDDADMISHALRSGFHDFHGFRGAFVSHPDGSVECVDPPPFTSAAVGDSYTLGVLAEIASKELERSCAAPVMA